MKLEMPRFSLRRLLASMTLVAVGMAGAYWVFRPYTLGRDPHKNSVIVLMAAASMFGAGVLIPFKRAWIGALLGPLAVFLMFLYAVSQIE